VILPSSAERALDADRENSTIYEYDYTNCDLLYNFSLSWAGSQTHRVDSQSAQTPNKPYYDIKKRLPGMVRRCETLSPKARRLSSYNSSHACKSQNVSYFVYDVLLDGFKVEMNEISIYTG
jgi:hypothetical protein